MPLAGASPNLAVVTESVRGSYGFGAFHFHKGFWQMPLHPNSREIFSFVTEDGVFTPPRVPQGASDSAVHFQAQMNDVLKDLLFRSVLVWIDDSCSTLLKLNARKCKLFAKRVKWCGKVIDGEGVEHDPERLAALQQMPLPPTGAALQHFLCAFNWLRDSMVDYARTTAALQEKLERVMRSRGRRRAQLNGAILEWSDDEADVFRKTLEMVERSCKLAFPDKGATVCMFSDASLTGYALVLTQVRNWQDGVSVEEQQHELLIFRGGLFKNAQKNWSIVEKEGYPIVKAFGDLDYMLVRDKGFHVGEAAREGKASTLGVKLVGCRYVIHRIAGESNLWADIISRWGQPASPQATEPLAVKRVTTRSSQTLSELRPLQDDEFSWPTRSEIVRVQQQHQGDAPDGAVKTSDGIQLDGKLWLPSKAKALLKRLFVVVHCGPQGHRGVNVMVELLERRFVLRNACQTVTRFINQCLLCKHVKGGLVIQRNWTVDGAFAQRNECLHLDYLYLGESYGATQYVLVLKDELTHYCELVAADAAGSQTTVAAILNWNKRFGAPPAWMSDKGSHFKNEVVELLAERLGASRQFAPVYTPWINGTVERVNRDKLQILRIMLLESRLDIRNWVYLLPIIQAILNHTPVFSLVNCAPVKLFTGLPATSALDIVAAPTERVLRDLPMDKDELRKTVDELRRSLHGLHRIVRDRRGQQRAAAMARSQGTVGNFSEGDYVLWSRVDKRLQGNKLLVRWVGPFQVTKAFPHSFLIRHLLTGVEYDVHGSRLKFYHDADLDEIAEIREHVSLQGIILEVRAIVSHRFNATSGDLELLVAWRGLQDVENS